MRNRFGRLWERIGAKRNPNLEFERLNSAYSLPDRSYHNLDHIRVCLRELDSARHLISLPDIVEFALWYHDIVYDSYSQDNEEKSAKVAYDVCLSAPLPPNLLKRSET